LFEKGDVFSSVRQKKVSRKKRGGTRESLQGGEGGKIGRPKKETGLFRLQKIKNRLKIFWRKKRCCFGPESFKKEMPFFRGGCCSSRKKKKKGKKRFRSEGWKQEKDRSTKFR